ncbi:hypothetical protein GCM10009641_26080 [Mycobacterium cookii]|uniref:Peptidase C39-like domain-containing protein n=1 Tax=Mycobacterium cookii TaxID=1775 RepID=A0A7I7KRQ5_9MYCO|nr:C39 family peptidase [Mycobacterium cookii]MCV7331242.1 hypothetical protein [Mycobacterium cookii]BBX44800.1 hypothetical protein MCOO_08150 [Mycobacterium cookii]
MTSTARQAIGAAARTAQIVALLCAAAVTSTGAVHATPDRHILEASTNHDVAAYGDPSSAASYWRQQHTSDCGEMAVAVVVGQITGDQPTEQQMIALAESMPSTAHPGPIWSLSPGTDIRDLPVLLAHYRVQADNVQTTIGALEQDLAEKRGVIVILNAETIWNRAGKRDVGNHFVVVTGIEPRPGVVHLNDSGISSGRDERVPTATFEQAWATNHNSAVVTTRGVSLLR